MDLEQLLIQIRQGSDSCMTSNIIVVIKSVDIATCFVLEMSLESRPNWSVPQLSLKMIDKSSAVAEMGDRGHNRHGPISVGWKWGGLWVSIWAVPQQPRSTHALRGILGSKPSQAFDENSATDMLLLLLLQLLLHYTRLAANRSRVCLPSYTHCVGDNSFPTGRCASDGGTKWAVFWIWCHVQASAYAHWTDFLISTTQWTIKNVAVYFWL